MVYRYYVMLCFMLDSNSQLKLKVRMIDKQSIDRNELFLSMILYSAKQYHSKKSRSFNILPYYLYELILC